jgi:tetratricopeptide (TPR) repeat protein
MEALEEESRRWLFSNPERYRQVAMEMLALARGAPSEAQARANRVHGNALRMEGRWEEALRAVQRALRLWRRAGDEVEWARTQTTLIPILAQLGENRRALAASRAGLAVFLRHDQTLPAARLLNNTGGIYLYTGRPREALRCYEQARELALKAPDVALVARTDLHWAMALQALGRHREALRRCAAALHPTLRTGQILNGARIQVVAANSLFQLGRFGKALQRFAKARTVFERESASRDVAECDLHICACYLELNRHGPALGRIEDFLQKTGRAWFEIAWAWYYRGVALARIGRPDEARTSLAKAVRLFRRHEDRKGAAQAGLEEAELLLRLGNTQEAARLAASVQRSGGPFTSGLEMARAGLVVATASLATGRLARARVEAERAWELARRAHTPGLTFRALHLLGQVALQQRQFEAANRFLSQAVRLAEQMRATVQLPFRQAFLADKSAAYGDLIWLRLEQGKVQEAHRFMEKAKSRGLADQLAAAPATPARSAGLAEERLYRELEAVRREYQQLTLPTNLGAPAAAGTRALPVTDSARRDWLEQRLGVLWDEWELRRVGAPSPARKETKVRPHRLRRGEAMVEYMVARERLIAFVSDQRGLRGWFDLGPIEGIVRCLELLQLNLDATLNLRGLGPLSGLIGNAKALLHELYCKLWAPLSGLADQRQLVVVPHGPLHQVPFGALFDGVHHLVELVELTLSPSRTVWRRCQERAQLQTSTTDLVLGYNHGEQLPFVETEALVVARELTAPVYLGDQARLERVTSSGQCRVLHLAVHGQFRPDNPEFSALQLVDGALTAADVTGMKLQASLVTLSACETGVSRVSSGDELTGLITAFLMAGSTAVLASLWRVDDEATADLMARFYQGLLNGRGKAASLQGAQIDLIRKQLHPLYWAAFAIVGDGGPVHLINEGGDAR